MGRGRSGSGAAAVTLREITRDNIREVLALRVNPEQERFVATNATSIAEAHVHQEAWVRAVYANETPVGFVMLRDENLKDEPEIRDFYYLWRLMIGAEHQGRGYGQRAVELVIAHVSSNVDATELLVSYLPDEGGPEGFYRSLGFEQTGKHIGEDLEMRLALTHSGIREPQ